MLHCLNGNAQTFIVTGAKEGHGKAVPYQLADDGHDVWLINFRGNKYSREHMWLSPDTDPDFWDFSFEEFAMFDTKAVIDFIQEEKRDDSKVSLIGFSEGTTTSFYGLATDPEYFD